MSCCRDESRIVDNGEGSLVCSLCGLVQEAALDDYQSRGKPPNTWDFPLCDKAKSRALGEFGFRFSPKGMDGILVDWVENGLLPAYAVDKTVYRGVQILANYQRPDSWKKKALCSLTEFSAVALYGTLLEEKIPRSANLISSISGVPVKRLWNLDKVFYPNSGLDRLPKPSDWMPGICYYLPISFKETQKICRVSDLLFEEFNFRPLTILSVVSFAYSEMRSAKYPSKKCIAKKQLCEITGISASSLMKGLHEMFGKKHPLYWDMLRPEADP